MECQRLRRRKCAFKFHTFDGHVRSVEEQGFLPAAGEGHIERALRIRVFHIVCVDRDIGPATCECRFDACLITVSDLGSGRLSRQIGDRVQLRAELIVVTAALEAA